MKLGQALNPRATHENTLVMRRSPGLELAKPVTVAAEEPAAVNVYQRVRFRPLYSRPVRHDLMNEWVGMSQRPFWRWLLRDKEWAWMSRLPLWQYLLLHWARAVLEDSSDSPSSQRYCVASPRLASSCGTSWAPLWAPSSSRAVGGGAVRRKCIPQAVTPGTDTQEVTGSGDPK